MSDIPKGIQADRVTTWFEENIEGFNGPLSFAPIFGGHSNLTYKLEDGAGRHYVLRRPPLGEILESAHRMDREYKILAGVSQTDVPAPAVYGLCEDKSVNDQPFYVMDYVVGPCLDTAESVQKELPEASHRQALGLDTADVLARLHLVNPDDVGLGDLGKKADYVARQLKRWRKQWENSKTRELPAMEETHELLVAAMPEQRYTGIVHGDYRLGNMLANRPGVVSAVLDWELCTLGDVLADVGYLLNNWVDPGEITGANLSDPPTAAGGFPDKAEWLNRYQEKTGFEVKNADYYRAFQHWRLAAIVEGVMARYMKGVMAQKDFDVDGYRRRIDWMANEALTLVRGL